MYKTNNKKAVNTSLFDFFTKNEILEPKSVWKNTHIYMYVYGID